jgi:hypothetical protein
MPTAKTCTLTNPPPETDNAFMAQSHTPADVRLICGMISADAALFDQAAEALAGTFSEIDLRSEIMVFDFTHYYDEQMGSPLWRQFVSFSRPVQPDILASAKVATNRIEAQFTARLAGPLTQPGAAVPQNSTQPARPINLDVGYVDESKLILASMKNFSHRIYLGIGVYAELTLMYHKGRWDSLAWTFPDYASGRYHPFLTQVRSRLRQHLIERRGRQDIEAVQEPQP